MNRYVIDFAEFLECYSNEQEIKKITALCSELGYLFDNQLTIADVGCGTGRSVKLIRDIWAKSNIVAIDISSESIEYIQEKNNYDDIEFVCSDARNYFSLNSDMKLFDVIIFSWSLFEMIDCEDGSSEKFISFIENVQTHMKKDGLIIVLQPTKGGDFEQLLSRFMPDSEEHYLLTHNLLTRNGFVGPDTVFPAKDDPQAIWSNFVCTYEELYRGIKSVIFIETNKEINRNEFDSITMIFLEERRLLNREHIALSDCVNMYYIQSK